MSRFRLPFFHEALVSSIGRGTHRGQQMKPVKGIAVHHFLHVLLSSLCHFSHYSLGDSMIVWLYLT